MNILGLEFSIKRAGQKSLPPPETESHEEQRFESYSEKHSYEKTKKAKADIMGNMPGYRERKANGFTLKTYRKKSPLDEIVFPEPENPDDPWQQQALANLLGSVQKMYQSGHFDVCIMTEAIDRSSIPQNGAARLAREKLRLLHCVDFDKMVPGLYDKIPGLMSCVFNGGEIVPEGLYE